MKLHTWIFKLLQVSLVIGMMFLSGWSNAEDQSALPNKIENVDFSSLPGGRVVIRIKTTESLANAPAGFTLSNPARIALDFPNVGNGLAKNNILANQGALKSVTLAPVSYTHLDVYKRQTVMDVENYATEAAYTLVASQLPNSGREQTVMIVDIGASMKMCIRDSA